MQKCSTVWQVERYPPLYNWSEPSHSSTTHKYEEQGQGSILSAFNNPRYLVNHYGGHLFDHPDSQISNPVSPTNRSKLSMRLKSWSKLSVFSLICGNVFSRQRVESSPIIAWKQSRGSHTHNVNDTLVSLKTDFKCALTPDTPTAQSS